METRLSEIHLAGISTVVPQVTQNVSDFYELFGEQTVKRIAKISGIESMHITDSKISTEDLCTEAATRLLKQLDISPNDIDAIVFASQTPTSLDSLKNWIQARCFLAILPQPTIAKFNIVFEEFIC